MRRRLSIALAFSICVGSAIAVLGCSNRVNDTAASANQSASVNPTESLSPVTSVGMPSAADNPARGWWRHGEEGEEQYMAFIDDGHYVALGVATSWGNYSIEGNTLAIEIADDTILTATSEGESLTIHPPVDAVGEEPIVFEREYSFMNGPAEDTPIEDVAGRWKLTEDDPNAYELEFFADKSFIGHAPVDDPAAQLKGTFTIYSFYIYIFSGDDLIILVAGGGKLMSLDGSYYERVD